MFNRIFLTLSIIITTTSMAFSQPGDPFEEDPDDDVIPFGRTEVLMAAGGFLGIWKISRKHKKLNKK